MPNGHDLAVLCRRRHVEDVRDASGGERVVAADLGLLRQPVEDAAAVVAEEGGLPRAASFRRHSSCSAAGSESATTPAPAWRCATPSRNTIVRIAIHVSSVASSGN